MGDLNFFGRTDAQRIAEATRRIEPRPVNWHNQRAGASAAPSSFSVAVYVTSTTATSGRFPGVWRSYDPTQAPGARWTNQQTVWVEAYDGSTLETGPYDGRLYGVAGDGKSIYMVEPTGKENLICQTGAGIPALAAGVPGTATCEIYGLISGALVDQGFTDTVYNLLPIAIPGGTWATLQNVGGSLVVPAQGLLFSTC